MEPIKEDKKEEEIKEDEKQKEIEETEIIEKEPWYKGPLRYIVAVFLILLLVLWIVPHYGVKQNPEPINIPTLEDLNVKINDVPEVSSSDIRDYVRITSEIKQLADKIISLSCSENHRICNAKALFYFVQNNFDYVNDPLAFEYFKTPQESLTTHALDCDDYSILLSSLLQATGFQTRFVKVPGHVFIQAKIQEAISSYKTEKDWINMDPTCQGCQFGEIHYSYSKSNKVFLE